MSLILKFLLTLSLSTFLISCSSSSSSNKNRPTNEELANDFVEALNLDTFYNVSLVKLDTQQDGFIVVYDSDFDTFDAYDLSGYEIGMDITTYIDQASNIDNIDLDFRLEQTKEYYNSFDHDLYSVSKYVGFDPDNGYFQVVQRPIYVNANGILFSKTQMNSNDLAKAQELIDYKTLNKTSNLLAVKFGVPAPRAKKLASIALQFSKSNLSTMTTYQFDQYTNSFLGSTYTEINSAIDKQLSGDPNSINNIYTKAAKVNKMTIKQVKAISDLFLKN